jgi:hypothetical protein
MTKRPAFAAQWIGRIAALPIESDPRHAKSITVTCLNSTTQQLKLFKISGNL